MRKINVLYARSVSTLTKRGMHADGQGLYLYVGDSKRWTFIFQWEGKRKEMGLGSLLSVSLADARKAAQEARDHLKAGRNPIEERKRPVALDTTFGAAADALIASLEEGWRNQKHRQQWRNTLSTYAADLRPKQVSEITTDDVRAVLAPIWTTKPETASRVRGRIERVLDAAKAQGLRSGENPAAWRGHLSLLMSKQSKLSRGHHRALPFEAMPDLMKALSASPHLSAKALEFTILTAARTTEALKAKWDEIDLDKKVWTVPADRMKAGLLHRVPLSPEAVTLLEGLKILGGPYVFPGLKPKTALSNMAMAMLLRGMEVQATVHGFRSTFRDWAGEKTDFPREVAEAALAHKIGDEVERAYRRGDALEKRRKLMNAWSVYCYGGSVEASDSPTASESDEVFPENKGAAIDLADD